MIIIAVDSVFQLISALNIAYVEYQKHQCILLFRNALWNTDVKLEFGVSILVQKVLYTSAVYNDLNQLRKWQVSALIAPRSAIQKLFSNQLDVNDIRAIIASTSIDYIAPLYRICNNSNVKVIFVEEGIGEYTNANRSFAKQSKVIRLKSLLSGRHMIERRAIGMFIMPDFAHNRRFRMAQAPRLDSSGLFRDEVLALFRGQEAVETARRYDLIYFEQPFIDEGLSGDIVDSFRRLENDVQDIVLKGKNAVIKAHPRSKGIGNPKYERIQTTTPWEAILPSIEIDKKVLISISSTSIVTPKLMLDKEPIVICLLELFKELIIKLIYHVTECNMQKQLELFTVVKNKYNDPDRFMIPKNCKELEDIVGMLL